MSYPIDLSISGKPSPRTEHPASAGRRRAPMTANRSRNQASNIFCLGSEEMGPQKEKKSNKQKSSGVVTKAELEAIKDLTNRPSNEEKKENTDALAFRSPRKAAPKGVPKLSLDDVVGKEDNTFSKKPPGKPKVHSPTSMDSCSWGTPLGNHYVHQKPTKGGGWQVNQSRKQVKSASSSQRKHDDVPYLDLKLSQSNEALGQLRKAAKEMKEDLNIEYLGASELTKGKDNIQKCRNKKQEFIEQAILQDQADRMKLEEERTTANTPTLGLHKPFDSRAKKVDQLFNTRSMVTGVQDDLSKRFRFSARILSLNGRDARREINGFFFIVDHTLTMYEFRQFGTRANALPFIQRGQYCHVTGHRKSQRFTILDIRTGKNLSFDTCSQPSLPDRLKEKKTVTFRITSTDDEETRNKLLYHGCKTLKQREDMKRFIESHTREEATAPGVQALRQIQGTIRKSLQSRGSKTMTSLFHHFKSMDKSGDGLLNQSEIKSAFQKFRIQVSDQEFDLVWKLVDTSNDGALDYGEFVRGFFGEMSEARKQYVRKAFSRLDPHSNGVGEADNLYKFFCPAKHPSVVKGIMTEATVMEHLQDVFQISKRRREIPYSIFEAYYEGVSIPIVADEDFITLLKTTWTL